MLTTTPDQIARALSDETIAVAFGWFSFGSKASVTSNPPHANMKARQVQLDELLAADLITHEHESEPKYGIDRHHFKGTPALSDVLFTDHAKSVLQNLLEKRNG